MGLSTLTSGSRGMSSVSGVQSCAAMNVGTPARYLGLDPCSRGVPIRRQSRVELVREAVASNVPTAKPGPPPSGAQLANRRRFH